MINVYCYNNKCKRKEYKIYIKIAPSCFGVLSPSSGNLTFSRPGISNKMQHYTVYLFLENCSTCFGCYLLMMGGDTTRNR